MAVVEAAAAGFDVGEEGAADADVVGELVGGGSAGFAEGLDGRPDALTLLGTFRAKKIRQVGGQWEASYRIIITESLGAEVKKVDYEHTPYVGHITYVQRMFTSTGPTKQAALAGPYTPKDEAIREIFSYSAQKKAWR